MPRPELPPIARPAPPRRRFAALTDPAAPVPCPRDDRPPGIEGARNGPPPPPALRICIPRRARRSRQRAPPQRTPPDPAPPGRRPSGLAAAGSAVPGAAPAHPPTSSARISREITPSPRPLSGRPPPPAGVPTGGRSRIPRDRMPAHGRRSARPPAPSRMAGGRPIFRISTIFLRRREIDVSIETAADLEGLQRAGAVVADVLQELTAAVRPGITTAELDALADKVLERHGARSAPRLQYGFPGTVCISVNEEAVHGVPGNRVIREGDLVTLDVTIELDGYFADAAVTVVVPPASPLAIALRDCAEAAFWKA